jgi:hypothetical protein
MFGFVLLQNAVYLKTEYTLQTPENEMLGKLLTMRK